jgi:peptidoglycan/xylan/chitin deacetylase (PgdA/CDA1 family)
VKVCVTVDMDNYQEYRSLVDPGGDLPDFSFYRDAVPRFLDLFARHGMRATFFVIGRDLEVPEHRDILKRVHAAGHELANHSWSHPYNLRKLPRAQQLEQVARCEDAVADLCGERPVGFRSPSGEYDAQVLGILAERGYHYDSSIFPTWFMWLFMLYGKLFVKHADYNLGPLTNPLAPSHPYWPRAERVYRPQARNGGAPPRPAVLELPYSTSFFGIPFYGTLFRRLGAGAFRAALRWHGDDRPAAHVILHLLDLVDWSGTPLEPAIERTPGLAVPFPARERFMDAMMSALTPHGDAVPLRELARDYRVASGLEAAA